MPDYKKMYFQLAASVAEAIEDLIKAQRKAEEKYIKNDNVIIKLNHISKPKR